MPRGRPRKLKDIEKEENSSIAVEGQNGSTQAIEKESTFDRWDVSSYIPYDPTKPLPKSEMKISKSGKVAVIKNGESRYYFSKNMKELIRVFHAKSKKTRLAWICTPNHSNVKIKSDHLAFRKALLEHGIPIQGRDF